MRTLLILGLLALTSCGVFKRQPSVGTNELSFHKIDEHLNDPRVDLHLTHPDHDCTKYKIQDGVLVAVDRPAPTYEQLINEK